MTKVILHVGMHKTGSTTIQYTLNNYEDDHFYYARLTSLNHSFPILGVFSKRPPNRILLSRSKSEPEKYNDWVKENRKSIYRSINEAGDRTVIFSGEGILRLNARQLTRLSDSLKARGCTIEVVAYIRPPVSYVGSVFQQHLRGGKVSQINLQRLYPGYRDRFEKFDNVFGRENVSLAKFDRASLTGNDVARDFCRRIGLVNDTIEVINKNESLPMSVIKLLFQYGRERANTKLVPFNGNAARTLAEIVGDLDSTKLKFSSALIEPLLASNAEDIQWMEERLHESLREPVDDTSPGTIHSEEQLLEPVAGAREKLLAALEANGAVPDDAENASVYELMSSLAVASHVTTDRDRPGRKEAKGRQRAERRGAERKAKADHPMTAGDRRKSPAGAAARRNIAPETQHAMESASAALAAPRANVSGAESETRDIADISLSGMPLSDTAKDKKLMRALGLLQRKSRMGPGNMLPIKSSPSPLLNKDKKLVVLWSPKSACTTTYVWFSHLSGFSEDVRKYSNWPHNHRRDVYSTSELYNDSLDWDQSDAKVLRVIREPYGRAVSIYRHALQTKFAERAIEMFGKGRLSAEKGYSFQDFLDFVMGLDMRKVDIHFRPQFHAYETVKKPDRVINISSQDMFASLNDFERNAGYPVTNFEDLNWLHSLEMKRKARQEPVEGTDLDKVPFSRRMVTREDRFPGYQQLLTPEAKQKIEAIYKVDFDAYRDYL